MNGIGERYITGDATDWEKFSDWAETVPHLIGNPLHHWTHMELKTFFGIEKRLSPETAREIWEECNEKLQKPEFRPLNIDTSFTSTQPLNDFNILRDVLY